MHAMKEAQAYVRTGKGPAMVYATCVRIGSHSNSDRHELYRDDADPSHDKPKDPLPRFRAYCLGNGLSEEELKAIEIDNQARYLAAHEKAMAAPNPDPASIQDFVIPEGWVSDRYPDGTHQEPGSALSVIAALNQTLKEEFRLNPDTFIWGQDMANKEKGGIFNVSKGLQQEFGEQRVF